MRVDYVEMGKRIAKRRKELGYRQSYVTEAAGLSDKYLSNIENARSIPSIDVLLRICTVLETTPDYILLGLTKDSETKEFALLIAEELSEVPREQQRFLSDLIGWIAAYQ